MVSEKSVPTLDVLLALERITRLLAKVKEPLSATVMKNHHGILDANLSAAAAYGQEQGFLICGKGNVFTLNKAFVIPENAYYQIVDNQIREIWSKTFKEFVLENTSNRDSKIVGSWTRPDFTLISYKRFPWTKGHEFDVVTFEVKRPDSANVLAVFEALAHATAATKAYVLFPIGEEEWIEKNKEQAVRVKDECIRHGVGLILIESLSDRPKPNHILQAARREIDFEKCSEFLDSVVSSSGKRTIAAWN